MGDSAPPIPLAQVQDLMSEKLGFNRNKSIVLIVIGSLAIFSACALQIFEIVEVRKARKEVANANEVIDQINEINSVAKSRANDERVFLLTGDKTFLNLYVEQQKVVDEQCDRLQKFVKGDEFQESMCARFLDLTRARAAELTKVMDAYNKDGLPSAINRLKQGHTNQVTQEHRNIFIDIIGKEKQHKLFKTTDLEQKTNKFLFIFIMFAIGECILFCGFVSFLLRDLADLRSAHNDLRLTKIRLEEFYSLLSHELRTPFTSIRGSLGLMKGGLAGELSPKSATLVEIAMTECERLLRLINELLDLEKIERGKGELKLSTIQPAQILAKALAGMSGMAQTANVRLVEKVKSNNPILCDEDRIVQVLTNLISNAIKFSAPEAEVEIVVDTVGTNQIRFSVNDSGPGIPKDKHSQLFQKFKQISAPEHSKHKGSGLGLAISKSIAEVHNGKLGFESEFGKGSTFWLILPTASGPPTN